MTVEERRRRWRKFAADKRERELDTRRRTAARCPKRHGKGVCGGRLDTRIGKFGQTEIVCEWCERQAAGLCRFCSRPVAGDGKAPYCVGHREEVKRRQMRASEFRHRDERNERDRARYWSNEERRAERNRQKALWRKANPEKVAAQKKRYIARHRANPDSAYMRYHKRYRKKYTEHRRDLVRRLTARVRGPLKIPRCKVCGKSTRWTPIPGHVTNPWKKCAKCSWPYEVKLRRATRRKLLRLAAEEFGLKRKPIKRPRNTPPRGPGDERICVTPGCDIVVSHRRKKCTKCRRLAAELAAEQLAKTAGRRRRVDLDRKRAAA